MTMRVYFDETWADVYMSKVGMGTYTLTAHLQGLSYEFKTETNNARLFDAYGDDDPNSAGDVADAVRNLITERMLSFEVSVGEMRGFYIEDTLWLPTPPPKVLGWGTPERDYFAWDNEGYYHHLCSYDVCTDGEDGMEWVKCDFETMADAERFADTDPSYYVVRYANIGWTSYAIF